MSYARLSNSDLYVFEEGAPGHFCCMYCRLGEDYRSGLWAMIWHVRKHSRAGHRIPKGMIRKMLRGWVRS